MTADIRTTAQRRKFASIEEMMNDPDQRGTEVKVAHRYGYWMIESGDEIDTDEIAEADAYLEAHIQHRISAARVTPTREQLIERISGKYFAEHLPGVGEHTEVSVPLATSIADIVLDLIEDLAEWETSESSHP